MALPVYQEQSEPNFLNGWCRSANTSLFSNVVGNATVVRGAIHHRRGVSVSADVVRRGVRDHCCRSGGVRYHCPLGAIISLKKREGRLESNPPLDTVPLHGC